MGITRSEILQGFCGRTGINVLIAMCKYTTTYNVIRIHQSSQIYRCMLQRDKTLHETVSIDGLRRIRVAARLKHDGAKVNTLG